MRAVIASVVMTSVIGAQAAAVLANEVSREQARAALALCEAVDRMPDDERETKLARLADGIQLSEAAIAADESDARAHLALFCNLGRQVDLGGLGWHTFRDARRAKAAIERAHALAPDDPDVLVAKGAMLRRLPRALGGDRELGRALLRRAVDLQPDHVPARLFLARAMAEDGVPDARARVYEALAVAKRQGAAREEAEAQDLLVSLGH